METLWLTLGFLGFVAATVFFLFLMTRAPPGSRHFFIITAVITGVAAFFYLTMATGATATNIEGRIFYWGRYIDWVITTPLLLLDLALLALASWQRNLNLIIGLIALDVFMILTGLQAGSSISEFARGFWFIVSTIAMVALLYLVYTRLFSEAAGRGGAVQSTFRTLALLTIVLWSLYPVVWLLGTEGFGAVGSTVEVFLFLILDFLAKIGFGFLLLTNRQALGEAAGGGGQAQTSRVRYTQRTAPSYRGGPLWTRGVSLPRCGGHVPGGMLVLMTGSEEAWERLRAWSEEPGATAVLTDIDGTLAPIVPTPDMSEVPAELKGLLRRISERYLLVAGISGRKTEDARDLIGLDAVVYFGNHGFEILRDGEVEVIPDALPYLERVQELERLAREKLAPQGALIEEKGITASIHYRNAPPEVGERSVEFVKAEGDRLGLRITVGRGVVEARPPIRADKGTAVRALVEQYGPKYAMFIGDDTTDLDAFRELVALREEGVLQETLRVGVASDEGPPEIETEADIVVDGVDAVGKVLRVLAGEG